MTVATLGPAPTPLRQDATTIGLVGLAHAISHFSQLLLPPLFPVFVREFGLSYAQVGLLVTVFFVISGLGQALSGFVVDRYGPRPVLFAAMVCFAASALSASQADSFLGLMVASVLAGVGNSPFHPVDFTILNRRVSAPRLGYAFSAHGLCGNLGWALAPVWLVSWMNLLGSWRLAYVASAVLIVLVLIALWWGRQHLEVQTLVHTHHVCASRLAFLRLPVVWWCFGFFFFATMVLALVQSYGAPILQAQYGMTLESATEVISGYMLAGALGMFVGGWVASRQSSSDKVVAACLVAASACLLLASSGWLGVGAMSGTLVISGFFVGIGGPSRDLMIKKATPKEVTGRVYGLVYSGLDAGLALTPLVFGLLMDQGHYNLSLFAGAVVLWMAVAMALGIGGRTPTH